MDVHLVDWMVVHTPPGGTVYRLFGASEHTPSTWYLLTFDASQITSPRELYECALRGDAAFISGVLHALDDEAFVESCLSTMGAIERGHTQYTT